MISDQEGDRILGPAQLGRHRLDGKGAASARRVAERLDVEADATEGGARLARHRGLRAASSSTVCGNRSRWRGTRAAALALAQALEGDALVRGMLIDEDELARSPRT